MAFDRSHQVVNHYIATPAETVEAPHAVSAIFIKSEQA